MSLQDGYLIQENGLDIRGYSVAGMTTSFFLPRIKSCFDVGQGLPWQTQAEKFFITHGHMDHASGLPYILAQKSMMNHPPAEIFCPPSLIEPMNLIIQTWQKIENFSYKYKIEAMSPESVINLGRKDYIKPVSTVHRVESFGYIWYETRKHLKPEFVGLNQNDLVEKKRAGQQIDDIHQAPLVCISGDTQIEFLSNQDVCNSELLLMEVSFWDERKNVSQAREWGHIHAFELAENISKIKSKKIYLTHISIRYPTYFVESQIKKLFSEEDQRRICIFPRP